MCFSAPASFTAAAVLLGLGTVTMRRARSRRELPYAAIPLLFGVQQLLEGMLWLTFPDRAPLLNVALTHLYSFFSHVLWPIYVPLAALALEIGWQQREAVTALLEANGWADIACRKDFGGNDRCVTARRPK